MSVIVGIIGGVLGVLAIWLSVKFYQLSSSLNTEVQKTISSIEASSRLTEVTTRDYTGRLVEAVIGIASENLKTSVLAAESQAKERVKAKIAGLQDPQLQRDLLGEIEAAFAPALRGAEKLQRLTSTATELPSTQSQSPSSSTSPSPAHPAYDWGPFLRLLQVLEKDSRFLSVKWLKEKKFADDLAKREALQVALDRSLLETYRVENPRNPDHPVLACRLKRSHPLVQQVLQ